MKRLETTDIDTFFKLLDEHISQQFDQPPYNFTLIAVGGTSLTLRGWKESTKDVDFMVEGYNYKKVEEWIKEAIPNVKADIWEDLCVFSTTLPGDYETDEHSTFKNFDVRLLSPLDVASTKIGRLNESDLEDIKTIVKEGTNKEKIIGRAENILEKGGYANPKSAQKNINIFREASKDW